MGDFNGDQGNSLGNRGTVNLNQRGVKLLDFANYFNLCLLSICEGSLETYFLHCEDTSQLLIRSFCLAVCTTALSRAELLTETLKTLQIMFLSSCR